MGSDYHNEHHGSHTHQYKPMPFVITVLMTIYWWSQIQIKTNNHHITSHGDGDHSTLKLYPLPLAATVAIIVVVLSGGEGEE